MTSDDNIAHSIICEHTRNLAAHDKSTSSINRKMDRPSAASESRLKEFNRSRRMLMFSTLRLRRLVELLPDDSKE